MLRFISDNRRLGAHVFVLLVVVSVALVGGDPHPAPAAEVQVASDPDSAAPGLAPVQPTLDFGPLPSPPSGSATATGAIASLARTQGADQHASVVFNPRFGLPLWLRTTQDTPLWSGSDPNATSTGTFPAGTTYVKPLGPFVDTRVEVYFPGDDRHPAEQGWVDTTSVEPSGVPPWMATPGARSSAISPDPSPLAAPPQRVSQMPAPDTTAVHIAIVDDDSGQLIYGEAPYTEVPQASTTKIATTIIALERAPDLNQRIKVTVSASAMVARDGSSTMGIEPGQTVSLSTLLHGMMLPSGNDAAEQVAVSLADSRDQYVEWMNQEAAALGLKDTHFVNPSGMDADGHYSSAYDMAMLARYAMRNAAFRDLAASTHYKGDGFEMGNLNRLLGVYPGADGVKIGYTDAAAKTIIASANHNGHRVFVSLMHSQDLPGDCTLLFNWVWNTFAW
jgi:hypothetical protein